MKKHLSGIICITALAAVIFSLPACGTNEKTPSGNGKLEGKLEEKYLKNGGEIPFKDLGGEKIKITAWWDPKPAEKGKTQMADLQWERIEYLEKTYNCKFEFAPLIESEMIAQITSSVAAGDPVFDVGYIQSNWVYPLADQKMLQNLDEIDCINLSEEKWVDFVTDIGNYKEGHYMMDPDIVRGPRVLLFWNKTMFKNKGLPDLYELQRKGEWTFDKLLECATALTEDTDGDKIPNVYGITGLQFMREQAIFSNGGSLVDVDKKTGKPTFKLNSPNVIEALQWLTDLRFKHNVVDEPEASTWDYYSYSFKKGISAMCVTEIYLQERFKDMKDDYGIVMFPKGPKGDYNSYGGMFGVCVMPANNPKAQENGFIYDLYTEPYEELGGLDSWKTRFENLARDEECLETIKMASDRSVFSQVYIYDDVRSLAINQINVILNNNKTPAQGIGEIEGQAQAILDDIYKSAQ